MKVLIIAPQYKPRGQFYELPMGLAYISSYLKSKGIDTKFVNLNEVDLDPKEVETANIVCTGGLSVHYHKVRKILMDVKKINPKAITIVGGGLFSSVSKMMLDMLAPYADIGVVGEGEEELYQIIKDIERDDTIGLYMAESIQNLDSLPFPDYEGMGVRAYLNRQRCGDEYYLYPCDKPRALPIVASRGCPYNCSFCFHPTGRVYRQRSLENVFKEIEFLMEEYDINILTVLDELISAQPERLEIFCHQIRKYGLKWTAQIRVDSVNEHTIQMMADSGCFSVSIGIEHINQTILDGYHKHTTRQQIEDTCELLYKYGIGIQGNILLGGPQETWETQAEAIAWRNAHARYMINMTAVIPYPGTELFDLGVKQGKINPKIFIAQECPYINFNNIDLQLPMQFMWGKLIEFKEGHLIAQCPHCGEIVGYRGIYNGGTGAQFTQGQSYRIGCPECNQRFDLKGVV
jgi:anaerobic magnesium-protoporphyrin IX monomethyl ester cyclase